MDSLADRNPGDGPGLRRRARALAGRLRVEGAIALARQLVPRQRRPGGPVPGRRRAGDDSRRDRHGEHDWQQVQHHCDAARREPHGPVPGAAPEDLRLVLARRSLGRAARRSPLEQRVERILLATDAVGNLFLPGDKVALRRDASRPRNRCRRPNRRCARPCATTGEPATPRRPMSNCSVRKAAEGRFVYTAAIDIPAGALQTGKYYELHVAIPQEAGEPVGEYSGLADPAAGDHQAVRARANPLHDSQLGQPDSGLLRSGRPARAAADGRLGRLVGQAALQAALPGNRPLPGTGRQMDHRHAGRQHRAQGLQGIQRRIAAEGHAATSSRSMPTRAWP